MLRVLLVVCLYMTAACQPESPPPEAPPPSTPPLVAKTAADSAALRAYAYVGGPDVWQNVPYLRFSFAVEREGERQPVARHAWDRRTGDYRLEQIVGNDSVYVTLFNVVTRDGEVYLNGEAVQDSARLAQAFERFTNDTYWLLAPTKLFDPGVTRTAVPDSSTATTEVIQLTFRGVGLTPGDRYWLYLDRATGRLDRWAYHLENWEDNRPPSIASWADYEDLSTPAGPARLATRHAIEGAPVAILTDELAMPAEVPDGLFSDPRPPALTPQ